MKTENQNELSEREKIMNQEQSYYQTYNTKQADKTSNSKTPTILFVIIIIIIIALIVWPKLQNSKPSQWTDANSETEANINK